MKKIILSGLFALLLAGLSSCEKTYVCRCDAGFGSYIDMNLYYYSEAKAQSVCTQQESSWGGVCTIQ